MIALQFEMLMTFVVVNNRHLPQKMKSLDLKMESFQPDQIRLDLTGLFISSENSFSSITISAEMLFSRQRFTRISIRGYIRSEVIPSPNKSKIR